MARPRVDHENQRRRIALAARDVIVEQGLENARLSEIGARVGYTTGAVQHYFKNKEALLLFTKNQCFDDIFSEARKAIDQASGRERLHQAAYSLLPTTDDRVKAFAVLEAFRGRAVGNPDLLRLQHQRDLGFIKFLTDEISHLQAHGLVAEFIDARSEAIGLNALIDGLAVFIVAAPNAFPKNELEAIVASHIQRAIVAPDEANLAGHVRRHRVKQASASSRQVRAGD